MFQQTFLSLLSLLLVATSTAATKNCKASPSSKNWPTSSQWSALNSSLAGALLKPPPAAAVCHPTQLTYNATLCPSVQAGWFTNSWVLEQPHTVAYTNWQNDSCVPFPKLPCSEEGFPRYVINATTKSHVKLGVDFARKHNVRLAVKGTGHDWLGRSTAPNSLLIWTHYMKGIAIHKDFRPCGCLHSIKTPALTARSGETMADVNLAASLQDLTVVSGGEKTVGVGGFIPGGGHGVMSPSYGLAADNVLEFEIVTPNGKFLTVNECQNQDIFWAMRGGGAFTYGITLSTTIAAYPSVDFYEHQLNLTLLTPLSETYWDVLTHLYSSFPALSSLGIRGYVGITPNVTDPTTNTTYSTIASTFILPAHHPSNTTKSLVSAIESILTNPINETYPASFLATAKTSTYPSFYKWWFNDSPGFAGINIVIGSRLFDTPSLTQNTFALKETLKIVIPAQKGMGASINFVGGGKVWDKHAPRGGGNAVNPAWRKAVVHMTIGVTWNYNDLATKAVEEDLLTNTYVAALRKITPGMGVYASESDPHEPDFQHASWGYNYERLHRIKRKVDPNDVLWCHPCVGNEKWEEVDGLLCRV